MLERPVAVRLHLRLHGDQAVPIRDPSVWLPFDLESRNVDRPEGADDAAFFFGSYRSDGSVLDLDGKGHVHRCSRESAEPLCSWDSFEAMLPSEFDRIAEHFDDAGRRIDPSRPIVPGPS